MQKARRLLAFLIGYPKSHQKRGLGLVACALMACAFAFVAPSARAESINISRAEARITANGQLAISSRFQTELPEQLSDALKQGVALDFVLSYQLEKPTIASYRNKLNQIMSKNSVVNYRLSFHPLTNRYRVSVGTFSSEYNSLNAALRGVGAIANWTVLDKNLLSGSAPKDVAASVRLSLSIANLPKPFQINALTSKSWQLDSGWKRLSIGS